MKLRTILGGLTATALTLGLSAGASTVRAADPGTVDIKVEMSYVGGGGTKTYEVTNVDPTASITDLDANAVTPTGNVFMAGDFNVDVDSAGSITIWPNSSGFCLDLLRVTITGDMIGAVSPGADTMFNPSYDVPTLTVDNTTPGTVVLTWTGGGTGGASCPGADPSSPSPGDGAATLNYAPPAPPTTTATPTTTVTNLPATGSNGSLTLFAAAFLAIGATTVVATRRRRHT